MLQSNREYIIQEITNLQINKNGIDRALDNSKAAGAAIK
jgi:hypothetical protein